jgi:hypothetical protein
MHTAKQGRGRGKSAQLQAGYGEGIIVMRVSDAKAAPQHSTRLRDSAQAKA